MADKGIIFSASMVRALLDGRKTQTRRLLNSVRVFRTHESSAYTLKGEHLQRALQNAAGMRRIEGTGWTWSADAYEWQVPVDRTWWLAHVPYAPGDRLYVRESYYQFGHWEPSLGLTKGGRQKWFFVGTPGLVEFDPPADYLSTRSREFPGLPRWYKRLGRFMPRQLSRMWLAVTDVRVQQLQGCTTADAIAEGVTCLSCPASDPVSCQRGCLLAVGEYADLWDSLHTAEGERWEDDPWVVAVSFDVRRGNIDAEKPE